MIIWRTPGGGGDHGDAPAREVERNLTALLETGQVRPVRLEDGVVQRVAQSGLELRRCTPPALRISGAGMPGGVEGVLHPDDAFRQRAGLVGAEDIHAPEVLDGVEPAHQDALPRQHAARPATG